jgi:5-oxoprolinase (ATP-hydrolysing) subunit A
MPRIDFNCDLGEGCGNDAAILPWITSANIACGAHAGDDGSMRATLRLCREFGVVAGAHPGYEDREYFGRRERELAPDEITASIHRQYARLAVIAAEEGVRLRHLKPHGALYNRSARDPVVATAIAQATREIDPELILIGLSGSESIRAAEVAGLRSAHEIFAERGYDANARLLPRDTPGAVLDSIDDAVRQARELALYGRVRYAGGVLSLRADTLCLHGDRTDAAAFARALRAAMDADGIEIRALER